MMKDCGTLIFPIPTTGEGVVEAGHDAGFEVFFVEYAEGGFGGAALGSHARMRSSQERLLRFCRCTDPMNVWLTSSSAWAGVKPVPRRP
jgi:hypothetical protein